MITAGAVKPFEANLNVSGGSLSALDTRADFGGQIKNLTVFLDLERHQQQAYSSVPNSPTTVGRITSAMTLFKTRYALNPPCRTEFSLRNAYHNNEVGRAFAETGLTQSTFNDSNQKLRGHGRLPHLAIDNTTDEGLHGPLRRKLPSRFAWTSCPCRLANLNERNRRLDADPRPPHGLATVSSRFGAEWVQNLYRGANRLVDDNAGQQITATDGGFKTEFNSSGVQPSP